MNYGFVIDNRACIGCHACSTACKSENEVPLGVYRTWVKYTETGTFPNTQRSFQVTRCNHCANPPCVRICPTGAMYQRDDGIVEFDHRACIGCKACMQACPYDAIHIDPSTGTAAKCHFCAHRLEVGLEPSCVVVCPTHAIVAGDLDDADSEISRVLSKARVTVRKPEKRTSPKLFYVEGNAPSLVPTAAPPQQKTFMWADVRDEPEPEPEPAPGPLVTGGRRAAHMVQVGYNAQHRAPWHWPVPAYLVTKGIAAGLFTLVALAWLLGWAPIDRATAIATGVTATAFMLATTALLVADLEKPARFLYILRRPQWRSWLARGAVFLIGFSAVAGVWAAAELGAYLGVLSTAAVDGARPWLLGAGVPLAAGVAVYTAFLFGQAEGRDLWQSALLPIHLLVQAALAGGAALVILDAALGVPGAIADLGRTTLAIAVGADLAILLLGELGMSHATDVAERGAREMTRGRYRHWFWIGAVMIGHLAPLAIVLAAPAAAVAAAALAIAGLYAYEHAFVMAPQHVPNS